MQDVLLEKTKGRESQLAAPSTCAEKCTGKEGNAGVNKYGDTYRDKSTNTYLRRGGRDEEGRGVGKLVDHSKRAVSQGGGRLAARAVPV